MIGTTTAIINSIVKRWTDIRCPSPCETDTIYARDFRGNLIEIEDELDIDEKCEEVTKRYYTETDQHVYDAWLYDETNVITTELLAKGKALPSKKLFVKYRPNHIQRTSHLSQMACDACTMHVFEHEALISKL